MTYVGIKILANYFGQMRIKRRNVASLYVGPSRSSLLMRLNGGFRDGHFVPIDAILQQRAGYNRVSKVFTILSVVEIGRALQALPNFLKIDPSRMNMQQA
jgi:hypothetical protein